MKYADVILPLPLENTYSYLIPAELEASVSVGCRVVVQFGLKRFYTAIVINVRERQTDDNIELKEISSLIDAKPIVFPLQLKFWQWIVTYYICKLGDVYKAALPSGLKLESETIVEINEDYEAEEKLRPHEQTILDSFGKETSLSISQIEHRSGLKNVLNVVASLMAKGAVEISEQLKQGFRSKTETYIRLAEKCNDEQKLHEALDSLHRSARQEHLLLAFLELSHDFDGSPVQEVTRHYLLEHSACSVAILNGLLKRGFLESYQKEVGRLKSFTTLQRPDELSDAQSKALQSILETFETKNVCLLHGVTSSGKTEIYIQMIDEALSQGHQVLYMLPEIAITTQITERLARVFGSRLLVYHSKFSDNERVEVWNRLLNSDEPMVVLGVRSSLFLPFHNLSLIIVDEEHEPSYKQQDPAPRYHARNAAIVLAQMHGAKTLLGSATPSIDSYYNALTEKYGLVELKERYLNCQMPKIEVVDVRALKRKKLMRDSLFSPLLLSKIQQALNNGEQVILFQNRRGFAPFVECNDCGWVPHCVNCDVSLTYHKHLHRLVCHYCGYSTEIPYKCPACEGTNLRMVGFGTEKVEEEISALFPDVRVGRLDYDTARTRNAYERILDEFRDGKFQILIGTQMISKGLDFARVSVVGILNADNLLNVPNFRAYERAFQLMIQVSGRAGRRDKQGTVVLQTSHPELPVIQFVQTLDYKAMVDMQLSERSMFHYPPYYRLIEIVLRGKDDNLLNEMSKLFAEQLRINLGERVFGPMLPPVSFVQKYFVRKIVLKIENAAGINVVRGIISEAHKKMDEQKSFRSLLIHYDVDPV